MGTKTIAIMDDVYERLVALKARGESFSEELRRLMNTKKEIIELAGVWNDITEKEAKKMKTEIAKFRKGTRLDELKRKMR
ncbi:hypothetical protein DRJ25_03125 [Candidatus Woesearchaeota archaeon]|nr:MAG: hypothetical protein DRJ25_03125 [Candidatus Woesearchaeota archaeon]